VQVNGKVRDRLQVPADNSEDPTPNILGRFYQEL